MRAALRVTLVVVAWLLSPGPRSADAQTVRPIEIIVQAAGSNPTEFETAQMIATEWRKLGLEVNVNGMEWVRVGERVFQQRAYDVAVLRYAGRAERIDPYHFIYQILHTAGRSNEVGYQNAEYDKYAELQNRLTDPSQRRSAVFRAQEIAAREQPLTPIVNRNQINVYSPQAFDGYQPVMGEGLNAFWNFLSLKPKTARAIIRMAYAQDNETLNPAAMVQAHDFAVGQLLYDRLVRIDVDGVAQKWAAESLQEINPTTYRVKLRAGMTFHDGRPVTAEDVRFSFDLFRSVKETRLWGLTQSISELRPIDGLTLDFVLKEPFAPFVANTLGQVFILPKHVWQSIPRAEVAKSSSVPIIGSGPFKLEYWQRDRELKLLRHDGHFGKPALDGIIRVVFGTVDGIVAALERGEVDFSGWWLESSEAGRLKELPHLRAVEVPNHGFLAVDYNNRREPFNQVAFRRALAYAVPKQRILDLLLEKRGTIAFSTIGPENKFWHNPGVEKLPYDLAKARRTLLEAGFQYDAAGKLLAPRP